MSTASYLGFRTDLNFLMTEPRPLEAPLQEVISTLNAKLFYPALILTLAIPEIYSSLEMDFDPDKSWPGVQPRYEKWCKLYLEPQFRLLTAKDCWVLRGGVLHQRRMLGRPGSRHTRVLFNLPAGGGSADETRSSAVVDGRQESVLHLDLVRFCERMTKAGTQWVAEKSDDPIVQRNLPRLLHYRPSGLPPHIAGVPVIA